LITTKRLLPLRRSLQLPCQLKHSSHGES
jgi:hypothetical protein